MIAVAIQISTSRFYDHFDFVFMTASADDDLFETRLQKLSLIQCFLYLNSFTSLISISVIMNINQAAV